ncbi:hypothetical protein BP6252_13395 [Coleophoma cylindrospora]|uniref:Uncharacterized protein n=1 Tax=Coleophoma cylindrospora TaxID=1849047 RepID=A0A3D8Q959_9HELO|nr:hypothetical protein BP6252_13395 [Coleophoma cylindrospora]
MAGAWSLLWSEEKKGSFRVAADQSSILPTETDSSSTSGTGRMCRKARSHPGTVTKAMYTAVLSYGG